MPWVALECPSCQQDLAWERENWRDELDGDRIMLGVVCDACEAEVEVEYELAGLELRVTSEGVTV